jgi:asparagine synthase (glutamine-hydrolysing)
MCGFVGLFSTSANVEAQEATVRAALESIRHRGPDGDGVYRAPGLLLAHARLSIIDLSARAQQPMRDISKRYVLVYNGEIYNYRELAKHYLADEKGLNRNSDTAVLLAMYRRYGRKCLEYLNGMFSFAIVDLEKRSIFLARDRFGEKPLYFLQTDGAVAFASEIGALKKIVPDFGWEIDQVSLSIYHIVGSIPAPTTIYKQVRAVKPGCWRQIDADGSVQEGEYWSLELVAKNDTSGRVKNYGDAIEISHDHLRRSVQSRMVSDVPIGLFLSGGLDSASILSLLSSLGFSGLDALCVDFEDLRFSEYRLAEVTAEKFGARLQRFVVTPESFLRHLDNFFTVADQPTTDGFNTYFVSMHARSMGIKVWLSGVGGDELFGGYPSFRRFGRLSRLARILQRILPDAAADMGAVYLPYHLKFSRLMHLCLSGDMAKRVYQSMRNPIPRSSLEYIRESRTLIPQKELLTVLDSIYPWTGYCCDNFQKAAAMESEVYLKSQLLRDLDNFSMAHSIETRAPFLDHELFGFVFSLPEHCKSRIGRNKSLLTDALPARLPDAIMAQPKRGFTFPMEIWMKEHMRSSFGDYVLKKTNERFWNLNALGKMWNAYLEDKLHWSVLWNYYAFARWLVGHNDFV